MQGLQEEVDQQKLTIQQLQEQLQALLALKQQTSTDAAAYTYETVTEAPAEDSTDVPSTDTDAAKTSTNASEGKGKIAAISVGEQVRA